MKDQVIEAMARAICAEECRQMGEPPGCDACDNGTCSSRGTATAAYDAITAIGFQVVPVDDGK